MTDSKKVFDRIERLLEIPALIDKAGKQRVAQRAEKRTVERKLKAREAVIRRDLMDNEIYQACSNADERSAVYEAEKHADPVWEELTERLEQLTVAVEKCQQAEEVLDHERKALKAALEREYAEIISQVLTDRMLASAVAGRGAVAA